ncbi:MAG: hypothetical protein KDC05_11485 [Bacteroidales bacterium]|nr:hypothetical protein [Bacteroidales bacterium]
MILSRFSFGPGIKRLNHDPANYKTIVLVGPVWMGSLIAPLRDFLKKYKNSINRLFFVCCCGSSDVKKEDKFGHAHVFEKVRELTGSRIVHCEAFPIGLVLSEEEQENSEMIMNTRLSNDNFSGEIQERFDKLVPKILNIESVS